MLRKLFFAASLIPLAACSATTMTQTANKLRMANNAANIAGGLAAAARDGGEAAPADADLSAAAPISEEALAVPLRKMKGKASALAARPRIAVAGYNVGAIVKSRAVASTRGGFRRSSASASMTMRLAGVDDALLQTIADAAYADLVARLSAAGIDVVTADELRTSDGVEKILPGEASYDGDLKRGNGDGKILVAGPAATGVSSYNGLGRITFNGNIAAKPSDGLDAVLLFPNLSLGFAWTGGSGNAMFAKRASVEGGAFFHVDTATKLEAAYSKSGRFVDGWATYGVKENVGAEDAFAVVTKTDSSNNALAVGLSSALGAGMGSRSSSEYTVAADPERYKALALKAAKGFNAAIVERVVAARSGA